MHGLRLETVPRMQLHYLTFLVIDHMTVLSEVKALTKSIIDNYEVYMVNDDLEGFASDLALFLQCHIEEPEDLLEDLTQNVIDMKETSEED